jgi:hypothetical protein
MVKLLGPENYKVQITPNKSIVVVEGMSRTVAGEQTKTGDGVQELIEFEERVIHLECGNIFNVVNIDIADIVMMETDFPSTLHGDLQTLLTGMHENSRILTYLDLRKVYSSQSPFRGLSSGSPQAAASNGDAVDDDQKGHINSCSLKCPFRQIDSNRHASDRYPTSWSVQRGHHFYIWKKVFLR